MYPSTTSDDILLGGSATTTDTKLEVIGTTKLGGNASTTGYFAVGTGLDLATVGAGDIFAADDATITGQFFTGSVRTGIINDFYDAACAVTNQFVTDVSDSGTFTCTALDTSGAWLGTAAALAANAANCSAGSAAGGVTAAGAEEDCTDYWSEAENTSAAYIDLADLSASSPLSYSAGAFDFLENAPVTITALWTFGDLFSTRISSTQATSSKLMLTGLDGSGEDLKIDSVGKVYRGDDANSGSGGGGSVTTSTAETLGQVPFWTSTAATPATLGSDPGLFFNSSLNILDISGGVSTTKATTTEWLNIGSTDVVATLGNTIGSGDLFVGRNATTTGVAYLGGLRTGLINDFFDASCSVANQFVTDISDSGTFTCTGITDIYLLNSGDTGTGQYVFADVLFTNTTSTNATTTNQAILGDLTFNGVTGNAWTDFCTTITGGSGLCDGTDADSGAGTGSNWLFRDGISDAISPSTTPFGIYVTASSTIDLLKSTNATVTDQLVIGSDTAAGDSVIEFYDAGVLASVFGYDASENRFAFAPVTLGTSDFFQLDSAGKATTTGRLVISGTPTNNFGDLWVGGDWYASGNGTTTNLRVTTLNFNGVDITDIAEYVSDTAGAAFTGNTETLATVTYQDADNTVDVVVNNDLSAYSNATSNFFNTAGTGLTASGSTVNAIGGVGITANADDLAFAPTEITGGTTWDDGGEASVAWTWNLTGTDPTMTMISGGFLFNGTGQFEGNASTTGSLMVGTGKGANLVTSGSGFITNNFRIGGNATTSGWFNVGIVDAVGSIPGFGAGDLLVGDDATITSQLVVGSDTDTATSTHVIGNTDTTRGGCIELEADNGVADRIYISGSTLLTEAGKCQ